MRVLVPILARGGVAHRLVIRRRRVASIRRYLTERSAYRRRRGA
ncbi:hypothetical protein AKJ09_02855 [Labilithrix luteola]|uniref:Uncharacterized protein n=1 Tax=Labilithrix luteola TaxID=1391654 RepID=A0A0K1PS33_9BACT|nr:hypothetical protein AKJ09_02855 [Labilithrix luteola]